MSETFRSVCLGWSTGSVTWPGRAAALNYAVLWIDSVPHIILSYRHADGEAVRLVVALQKTPTRFGGGRWWFTCPLVADRVMCQRRIGNLNLSRGEKRFGYQTYHKLAYRSSQTAHEKEQILQRAGTDSGAHPRFGFAAAGQAVDAVLERAE